MWLDWWRDLMLIKGGCREAIINVDHKEVLDQQAKALSLGEIKEFLASLGFVREAIFRNANPRLALEWLMLRLPRKADTRD
jgi:DNA polymerase-3 subunit delta'